MSLAEAVGLESPRSKAVSLLPGASEILHRWAQRARCLLPNLVMT